MAASFDLNKSKGLNPDSNIFFSDSYSKTKVSIECVRLLVLGLGVDYQVGVWQKTFQFVLDTQQQKCQIIR